eukprot:5260765-Amphidinium_carterae.1
MGAHADDAMIAEADGSTAASSDAISMPSRIENSEATLAASAINAMVAWLQICRTGCLVPA